ncbi:MAG: hypothetical protein WDZ83_08575 [Rhizobiaceae bacterium]
MPSAQHTIASAEALPTDPDLVLELIDSIQADLDRLRRLVQPKPGAFDPSDPRNKNCDGKLTPQGVECCYRMFDDGRSRYSVAQSMKISFAAATHRFATWAKAGGRKRKPMRLG